MKKDANRQKITNHQGNINITAWWDVYNWPYQQNIDNSQWHSIPKEESVMLEKVSKFIIENFWKIWGIVSGIASLVAWVVVSIWNFLDFFGGYRSNVTVPTTGWLDVGLIMGSMLKWLLDWHILLMLVAIVFAVGGITVLNSMKYRDQRQCPKCKKHYGLVEIWEPMEKEMKTSKGWHVTQVRHYECDKCGFKKEEKDSFTRKPETSH